MRPSIKACTMPALFLGHRQPRIRRSLFPAAALLAQYSFDLTTREPPFLVVTPNRALFHRNARHSRNEFHPCSATARTLERIASLRPVRGRTGEPRERFLFGRLTAIFFHLKVVPPDVRNAFVEQSNRVKSPSIVNETCNVAMPDMHNQSFRGEILSDFPVLFDVFGPLAKI